MSHLAAPETASIRQISAISDAMAQLHPDSAGAPPEAEWEQEFEMQV